MVDHFFPVLDACTDRLDELEDRVLRGEPGTGAIAYGIRRDLRAVRRVMSPLRDALLALLREELPHVGPEARLHLRDCHDHAIQLMEIAEGARETTVSLMDLVASTMNQRTNEAMKFLTMIATIFIPLSFVAGLYGMNFDTRASSWNMPELRWYWGYPFVLGVMLVVAVALSSTSAARVGWDPAAASSFRAAETRPV